MTTLALSHRAQDTGLRISLSQGQWALALSLLAHLAILAWPHGAPQSPPPNRPPLMALLLPAPSAAPAPAPEAPTRTMQPHTPARPSAPVMAAASPPLSPPPLSAAAATPSIATPTTAPVTATQTAAPSVSSPATAPVAPPRPPSAATLASYGQALSERLGRLQRYPRLAEMRGWQGEVQLHLRIARKGALLDVQIARSSGYDILDRNALQLVQDSAPLPALPDTLGDGELDIVVPIHYRLGKT